MSIPFFLLHPLDKERVKLQLRSSPVTELAQVLFSSPTGIKEHIGSEGTWLYCSGNLHLAYFSQGFCRQLALDSIGRLKSFPGSMCTNQICNTGVTVLCIRQTSSQLENQGFILSVCI